MRVYILICTFMFSFFCTYAQKVKQDINGNYIAVKPSLQTKDTTAHISTGKTYTDTKGTIYTVFKSPQNKLFIIRISKNTGKQYKQYLKLE